MRIELHPEREASLDASALRARLKRVDAAWAWIVDDVGARPWAREGDAIELTANAPAGLAVAVDDDGLLALRRSQDVNEAERVAFARCIARGGWRRRTDDGAWRWIVRAGEGVWQLSEPPARALNVARRLLRDCRYSPVSETEAEALERTVYERESMRAAYERTTDDDLTDTEQALLAKWVLPVRPGARVLDIGCGAGREALGMARRGLDVVGLDVSEPLLEAARSAAARLPAGCKVRFEARALGAIDGIDGRFDAILVASDVYASIPGAAARVAALARCGRLLDDGGVVIFSATAPAHVPWPWRALVDAPRELLRACGARCAESGDRLVHGAQLEDDAPAFRHVFATEDEVRAEIEAAGLEQIGRVSSYYVARASAVTGAVGSTGVPPRGWMTEVARALAVLPRVEIGRRRVPMNELATAVRLLGLRREGRGAESRARLARVIGWVDRLVPGGPNCLRRALLEVALDRGAARERIVIGFRRPADGHAWMSSRPPPGPPYELEVQA